MKKIAILLTVYNRREKTLKCLERLGSQIYDIESYLLDVYLTDDGSTDGTSEAIKRDFPSVHIIQGDGSLFWNRGMLAAWKEAAKENYDFYIWINDDVDLKENAISRLLGESAKHGDKAVVGGSMSYVGEPNRISYGGRISRHKMITEVSKPIKCNTLAGNLVLIPKHVYERIGMNDPYFRHSDGDLDYTLRANEAGLEVWLASGMFGECNREDLLPTWANPAVPLVKRWKSMMSIKGCNPRQVFYFNKKHYGFLNALYRCCLTCVHVIFPQIWMLKK